jgi:hypothetical protein
VLSRAQIQKSAPIFFEIRLSAPNGSQATSVHWVLQTIVTFNAAKTSSRAALGGYKQSGFF